MWRTGTNPIIEHRTTSGPRPRALMKSLIRISQHGFVVSPITYTWSGISSAAPSTSTGSPIWASVSRTMCAGLSSRIEMTWQRRRRSFGGVVKMAFSTRETCATASEEPRGVVDWALGVAMGIHGLLAWVEVAFGIWYMARAYLERVHRLDQDLGWHILSFFFLSFCFFRSLAQRRALFPSTIDCTSIQQVLLPSNLPFAHACRSKQTSNPTWWKVGKWWSLPLRMWRGCTA